MTDQNINLSFVTGHGQSDSHATTLNDGRPNSHRSAGQPYETITGKQIAAMVATPPSVPKDAAQWFIPSTYADHDARSHDAQRDHGSYWWLTVDIDKGHPSIEEVGAALDTVVGDASRIIYASRGSTPGAPKWRVLLPLKEPIEGRDFYDTQTAFFGLLEDQGLICDRALARPAQLIYLPNRGDHYEHLIHRGHRLSLGRDHPIIRRRSAERDRRDKAAAEAQTERDRKAAERARRAEAGDVSPVDHFNAHHTIDQLLGRYGYEQLGQGDDWHSPMQTSKTYATRCFGDYWISLSGSDADAGIGAETRAGHRHGDAFDLFVHFEHGGDFDAAVRSYVDEARLNTHKPKQTTNQEVENKIWELAALPVLDYEVRRETEAKALGLRVSVLDKAVEEARPAPAADLEDEADAIETVDPWPEPVDGASLAEEIRDRLRAHVVFGADADVDCATLWIIGTYLMETWRLWPRLLITSPTKQCGKSTLLEVIDAMAHRGFVASNASPAAIFRAIEAWKPTLLLDEADTWMKQNEELAGILNSGHTRRTARVIRVQEVNGEHVPIVFSTWCPTAIAGIGSQRDTLMSRSIIIGLRRKLPEDTVERMPVELHGDLLRLRRKLVRWAADNAIRIGAMTAEPPTCGNDRMQDNFTPLSRIAAALGEPWPDRIAAAYAVQAKSQDEHDDPAGVMMLRDIAELFATRPGRPDRIASSELVTDLIMMEDRPWAEWKHGRPLATTTIANLMKPFGIKATVAKLHGSSARVYLRREVEAAAARYAVQSVTA